MSARPLSLVLACLLVLAGCSAAPAETPSRTVTPAPVPTATATVTPPWMDAGRVDEVSLARSRVQSLEGVGYLEVAWTVIEADGKRVYDQRVESRHADAHRLRLERNATDLPLAGEVRTADVWTNGSLTVQRLSLADGTVRYDARPYTSGVATQPQRGYAVALAAGRPRVVERTRVNGTTRYTLAVTGLPPEGPLGIRSGVVSPRGPGRARAVVTEAGVIVRFAASLPVTVEGTNATLEHRYRLRRGPITVDRPAWFRRARSESDDSG